MSNVSAAAIQNTIGHPETVAGAMPPTRPSTPASRARSLFPIGPSYPRRAPSDGPSTPLRLYTVDETVTDGLRKQFNARTLAEARAREAELNKR